jgi:hypothetical protein
MCTNQTCCYMTRAGSSRVDDVEVARPMTSNYQGFDDKIANSRVRKLPKKPYSPSPGAGSRRRRVPETCFVGGIYPRVH